MIRALLDTSFVVALSRDEGVTLERAPARVAISAVTLCGLHHGVLAADDSHRAGRLTMLAFVERRFAVLPLDARVAPHYGRIVAEARRAGRRPGTADALIAATAAAHDIPVYTRDRDFLGLAGVEVVLA